MRYLCLLLLMAVLVSCEGFSREDPKSSVNPETFYQTDEEPTRKAYERINSIRRRAGLQDLADRSKEEFFYDVMNERKWELAFEYHRKLDLCRWNKLVEVVRTMTETNPEGALLVKPHHQLLPVPSKEITKNPNLTQNPGY